MHRAADAVQMWKLASVALTDAYTDFILSCQAMNCTPAPMDFYRQTAGKFLEWIESQGIARLDEITARHVRQYPAGLISNGCRDTILHANARAIRTLVRFWHAEGYLPQPMPFEMPRLEKKQLPVLTVEQLQNLGGWASLDMVEHYAQMVDEALSKAH